MPEVLAARAQMGTSLAFHIIFAALGVGLPLLVVVAEGLWLRTHDRAYYRVARLWSKGMAILFAVGAVSGTVLSFELGLLWPTFMKYAGGIIGLPFGFEGFAFFIEAIFMGIYLFSWDRLSPRAHWLTGIPIVIAGPCSAAFVSLVNAWMQMPTGFRIVNGHVTDVQPLVAMFAPPWRTEVAHATMAAYVFTAFAVAGVCAFDWLRGRRTRHNRASLRVAMLVAMVAIPLQFIIGDIAARFVADNEPAKFAAMEVVHTTERAAPMTLGGIPTADGNIVHAIEIPYALSLLVAFNINAQVIGMDRIAPDDRPPIAVTHLSFDAMVGSGSALLGIALIWFFVAELRKRPLGRALAFLVAAGAPLALIALEAGWFVTEFGRQPWIAHGLLRTADAATTTPDLDIWFMVFSLMYVLLGVITWWLLRRIGRPGDEDALPAAKPIGSAA
jgi:cytochrome d ubiquinol oxidase subunit I